MNYSPDKKQLYNRVVYMYFCFFSMYTAQAFSVSATFGAALFFAVSALLRIFVFSLSTQYDSLWRKAVKALITIIFLVSAGFIIVLYPMLFPYEQALFAIAVIILIFLERETENIILRIKSKKHTLDRKGIGFTVLTVELVFTAAVGIIAFIAGGDNSLILLAGMAAGMTLNFFRQIVYRNFEQRFEKPAPISPDIKQVRSAGIYYGMVITSGAALNIFAFTFILFIMLSVRHNFLFDFIIFSGISLVYILIYIGTKGFANSSLLHKLGKNAAFVTGTAVAIFSVYIFRDSWFKGAVSFSLQTALLIIGIMLQMTANMGLKEDVLLVLKLYDKKIDEQALEQRKARLDFWTEIISEIVFVAVLLAIISNPVLYTADITDYIMYAPVIGSSVIAIPTVFLFAALIYSVRQPLTEKIRRRLKQYEVLLKRGEHNPDMEKKLINVLIKKYKKRIGVYIIRAFLKRIMYHTVEGRENVKDLPGVFVFNHGDFYGPIAAVVFLPYDIRPWILDRMLDSEQITRHMYEGTFGKIRFLPVFIKKAITAVISPAVIWGLKSFDPIPVYRGAVKSVIRTFQLSVECLNSGDSILLFPENPRDGYSDDISSFYSGFAELGRMYSRKAGKELTFYPVFASKRSRTLRIGEGIKYDRKNGRQERDRIVASLEQSMRVLREQDDENN